MNESLYVAELSESLRKISEIPIFWHAGKLTGEKENEQEVSD